MGESYSGREMYARFERKRNTVKEPTDDHLTPTEYACPACNARMKVRNRSEFVHKDGCDYDGDLDRNWIAIDVKVYGK